ncbi:chemotaxis protein CheD [Denitratisoma oestradiolicum]|uniref:Probable chemoreceptor glutamine deamidase CheD n=1 Tax=Denitratisoma oestradiolicum TaxID=311182 RepID=A0A6S6XX39_9PROT|nr:chemotaxis protein CheD [Denitratisoma oestradiolicum]TWO78889.1 chemotaxis protein CheD [Denitratisoma oestradiolicum]CAB1369439.1 putative chemoreceptor glutamine deamidase CheD 2 [Denitratisoma oestradiolicum]
MQALAHSPTPSALSGKTLERLAHNINPGGWAVETERPISTLLGSCVAVCLYDPKLRLGGMNHFLLPSISRSSNADIDVVLNGDYAMEVLVNALLDKGAQKRRLVAKAFGGGNIVSSIRMAIGDRNVQFAREWLGREGIPLLASDFGGPWSRKVICVPASGEAYCRRTPITQPEVAAIVKEEQAYEQSLVATAKTKRVELF